MTKVKQNINQVERQANLALLFGLFSLSPVMTWASTSPAIGNAGSAKAMIVQKVVKGQIVDKTGEPIIGATVLQKNGKATAVTDLDGNFTINVDGNATLQISYIGYKTQEIAVKGREQLHITMEEDSQVLQELVVVGYGSQKKETLTGAVTVVDSKMLDNKGTLSNPAQALQGQVPGVFITRNSSAPGAESWNMKLRGSYSKNQGSPLVIIDGVESDDFSQLNPSDIESINFLKDASAAIYGSKAAGGVILVQTKKAKNGKVQVDYSGSVTAKFVGLQPTLMNLDEWCDALEQARLNDGKKLQDDQWLQYIALARQNKGHYIDVAHSGMPIQGFNGVKDFVFFDTDWEDILWGTSYSTSQELSVSGGNDRSVFRLSGRYMYDGSNLKWGNNNNKRYNLRLTNTFHITKKFDIDSNISFYRQDNVSPTQINEALTANTQQPGFPSSTIDGKPYAWGNWATPNWRCELGGDNKLQTQGIGINETLGYKINKDFNLVGTFGMNTSTAIRDIKNQKITWYNYAGTEQETLPSPNQEQTYYIKTTGRTNLYTLNAYLNWAHTYGSHDLKAMVGTQYSLREYDYTTTKAMNILESLDIINGTGEITLKNADASGPQKYHEAQLSYFARLNYDYKQKYLVEGNFRYDGSSKFQPANRWSAFGGVSVGWRISEEEFLKKLKIFDDLKLRLSYGSVGNQTGIDRYDGIQLYNFTQGSGALVDGERLSFINTNGKLLSTDRTWERIHNYNIGLDFTILNSRLTGTFEVFWKKCNNMLISVTSPATLGDAAPTSNKGKFKANGYEGTLTWSDHIGSLKYHVGGTLTYATNELVDNGGDGKITDGIVSNREGYPLRSIFGLRYCGKIQNQDQMDKYMDRYGNGNNNIAMPGKLRLGDNMFEDVNKDGKLTEADFVYLGTDDPKLSFSFNAGVEYKGFDLSVVFQGVGKRTIWRDGDGKNVNWRIPMRTWYQNSTNQSVGNVWSPETPDNRYPTYTNTKEINTYNYRCSSWSVEDGSYLRLKNITIGYNLPKALLAKTRFLTKARVYVSGADLWETSKIHDGWDPEASSAVSGFGRYPFTRTVSMGMNLTF